MKIAMIVPGGVDRSAEVRVIPALLSLIERLARLHQLHVIALYQEAAPASWELRGAQVHNVGAGWSPVRAVRKLLSLDRGVRFDVVQSIFSGNCGLAAVLAARRLRRPVCVHVAGGEHVSLPDIGYGGRLRWYGRMRERFVLGSATVISAASDDAARWAEAHGVSVRRIPLGVDLRSWPPVAPVAPDDGPARLVHVASLNRVKDQDTLLQALARLARRDVPFTLDIVGEDTLGGQVQRLAAKLGLESRVKFHGFLTHGRTREVLRGARLHLVSSRHEAGPLAMLEAAICGVPTVGTAVGHLAEWSPEAALAVPVGDAAEMASAIAGLIGDEPRRLRLAQAAQRRALAMDADETARRFLAMYAELAG